MSPARDTSRLHRSLAAVESRYVRELARREPSSSPPARPAAALGRRTATERHDFAHRRVRAGFVARRPRRSESGTPQQPAPVAEAPTGIIAPR